MEYVGTQLSWSQSEARQAVDDRDAKAEAEASKQRRKVQNRKNQRARRESALAPITHSILRSPLQAYGSRAKTQAIFRSRAHSESSAGASTSPTTFPLKKCRQHQSAQQSLPHPMDRLTRTQAYWPNVQLCFVNHYPRPPTSSPLLFPSRRTTSSISFTIMSVAP
jgi:hypothetical protein